MTPSRTLFSWRHFSGVLRDTTLPNGVETTTFTLEHPGAVVILPITATGSLLFLSQYRPAVGKTILELPAGTLERGEDPAACAAREVIEETGFAAGELVPLGHLLPAPGFCNEVQWCYIARELTPASAPADEDEVIEVVEVQLAELPELIASGRLYDGKSLGVLMKGVVAGVFFVLGLCFGIVLSRTLRAAEWCQSARRANPSGLGVFNASQRGGGR